MLRRITLLAVLTAFLLMPSGAARANSGLFLPYVVYPTGSRPEAVTIGDVNNDGRNDVVMTFYFDPENGYKIFVFLQDAAGTLQPPIMYPTLGSYTSRPLSVDIGDLNNDGKNDVVINARDAIGVFLQNDGGFDPEVTYPSNHSSHSNTYKVRIGDFNNDFLLDVVSIDWGTQSHAVDVFLQNATGTLNPPVTYQVAHGGYDDLEVGDVNNDGLDDIVVMSGQLYAYDNIGVLLQQPDGMLSSPVYYDLGGNELTRGVAIGDVNNDALQDIVVTYGGNRPRSFIAAFLQNSTGTLEPSISYTSYDVPEPVEVADLDSDGRVDVVVAHGGWVRLGVYLQRDDGTLAPEELYPIPYASHYNPHGLAVGDINEDGGKDAAIADYNHGLVVLYHSPPDCLFRDDAGNDTRLLVWGENWTFTGPGGFEASGTGAKRHGDRVIVSGRSGDVVVSGEGLCPAGPGHFRAVQLEPPRAKFHLDDSG